MPSSRVLPSRWTPLREANGLGLSGERLKLWDSKAKHIVVPAGRQSLKTEICAKRKMVLALKKKTTYGDARFLYGAPTQQQAERIVWDDYEKLIPKHWISKISISKHYFETTWGARLYVIGLDEPARAEGNSWDGVCLDESSDLPPGTWEFHIQPLVSARDGFSYHIGVPDYEGRGAKDFKKLCDYAKSEEDPDWQHFWWKSDEVLSAKAIEAARRSLDPLSFEQEYEAGWVNAPGRAYYCYDANKHVKRTPFIHGLPVHVSCDFNRGHHNWIIAQTGITSNGSQTREIIRVIKSIYIQNATVEVMCNALDDTLKEYSYQDGSRINYRNSKEYLHFYGDGTGTSKTASSTYSDWEQIEKRFPRCTTHYRPNGPIGASVDLVNSKLRNAAGEISIEIDPSCKELINDLEYVKTAELYSDQKTGRLTHSSDCLRYLLIQRKDTRSLESFSENQVSRIFNL